MTGRTFRAAILLLVILAQTQTSLGFGVGTVRYTSGSSLSIASLSSTLSYGAPTYTFDASGALAALPSSEWFVLYHTDAWATTPPITDAIRLVMTGGGKVYGLKLRGDERRFDIGNFEAYFQAFVEFALADEKHGKSLREHIKKLI